MKKMTFKLTRPAKKAGGDRYEKDDFVIYIPQDISRKDGKIAESIEITFDPKH